jgi:tetratricopeptide (TPR) repeat protein
LKRKANIKSANARKAAAGGALAAIIIQEMDSETFNKIYSRANKRVHHFVFQNCYRAKYLRITLWQRFLIYLSITDFKKCLIQQPKHWPSMFLLGKIYQRLGDFKTALFWFESAFAINDQNKDVLREAALTSLHLDNVEKSIYYSSQSIKLKPNDITLIGNHAMNLLIAQRDKEAKEYIRKAIELEPGNQINKDIEKVINSVTTGQMRRLTCKDVIG